MPELRDQSRKTLKIFVKQWHDRSSVITKDKSFDDIWAEFAYGWTKVKWPKGEDILSIACQKALIREDIPESNIYETQELQLLVKICLELQLLAGDSPFWLSCRSAAGILGVNRTRANKMLSALEADEVITQVKAPSTRQATRYNFKGKSTLAIKF